MNVYDFDKTIYDGDASLDFWKFSVKRKPSLVLYLPYQVFSAVLFKTKIIGRKKFKENFFSFLISVKDLIISASPEFILKEMTDRLNIKLMGTRMNPQTGKIDGENCRAEEKVKRFYQIYPDMKINKFYSDSKSDAPLKQISKQAYLVKGDELQEWK